MTVLDDITPLSRESILDKTTAAERLAVLEAAWRMSTNPQEQDRLAAQVQALRNPSLFPGIKL